MTKVLRYLINNCPLNGFILMLIGLFIFAPVAHSQDFSNYQKYNDMTGSLKTLVNANKSISKIESIGKTLEGRDLWMVTIANPNGIPIDKRPGMFIGGNFEGDHLIGSQISLSIIEYLLDNYEKDDEIRKSIDDHVYYVFPRANPDAAEKMFDALKTGRKTNTKEYDGDNDGRMDEDGPEDLNGDGQITFMRVKDENGLYMINPDEPRLLKKADPAKGESGEYSIYWEGVDNDKDGFINEDPAGGVDINRNFMHAYPYFKEDAGWHMISELESKALIDWIIAHRNVAIMLNFGESDNLISVPGSSGKLSSDKGIDLIDYANLSYAGAGKVGMVSTGGGGFGRFGRMFRMGGGRQSQQAATQATGRQRASRNAATTFNTGDLEYFKKAGEKYKELTGIKTQPALRDPKGSFFQYGYFQYGVLSFSTPGWGIDIEAEESEENRRPGGRERVADAGGERANIASGNTGRAGAGRAMRAAGGGRGMTAPAPGGSGGNGVDSKFLKWMDKNNIKAFVDWKTFDHPEFGEVEIGGFTSYEINNPPASMIAKLGESHAKFVTYLSGLYAKVKIAKTEVINHEGGLFRIKAEIENQGFLPTSLRHGATSRAVKPTMVQLGVKPEAIISGNSKTNFFQSLDGSGKRQKYEWLIKGKSGDKIELKVVAQKAGADKQNITLK